MRSGSTEGTSSFLANWSGVGRPCTGPVLISASASIQFNSVIHVAYQQCVVFLQGLPGLLTQWKYGYWSMRRYICCFLLTWWDMLTLRSLGCTRWVDIGRHCIHHIFAYETALHRCIDTCQLQWHVVVFTQPMGIVCQRLGLRTMGVRSHLWCVMKGSDGERKEYSEYKQ